MAATSLLYHTQGLRGYRHLRTEYRGGAVYHHVELDPHKRRCRLCHARWNQVMLDGSFERTFRALPVGRRPQFIVLHGHEQACRACGEGAREPIDFAEGKRRHLKAFSRYIIDLCGISPIKHVAELLGVGWDVVKDIFKQHLKRQLAKSKTKWKDIRHIAVDEFATHKGHRYMTVVLDLETGAILHAKEGKDAAALTPFLWKLKRRGARLQAVAMDMSPSYAAAVRTVFPQLDIVHDPYHVVALANKAIDETRRDLCRELEGADRKVLKGSRFLLLKGYENLKLDAAERLDRLLELNEPLFRAHLLKEDLRAFWSLPDRQTGDVFLECWLDIARESGLPHFQRLADTIEQHRAGLLSYFRHYISTGPLEGINNKIKVLKRQTYGFRDMEYFRLRLLTLHEATLAFPG